MNSTVKTGGLFGLGTRKINKTDAELFIKETGEFKSLADEITPLLGDIDAKKTLILDVLDRLKPKLQLLNTQFSKLNNKSISGFRGGKRTRRARGSRSKTYKKRH